MRVDLHNHTPLCKHASGTPRAFLERARELGIGVYGFSCHAPMRFDEAYRMSLSQLAGYLAMIEELRWEEREKGGVREGAERGGCERGLEILCGLEVDYIAGREELLESSVLSAEVDYLIGSVHFLDSWGFDNPEFLGEYAKRDMAQCWREYLRAVRAMVESGHFDIVGHLDLLKVFGYALPSGLEAEVEELLESISQAKMSIEINAAGLRKVIAEPYPSEQILSRAFAYKIPITFSSDAHRVEEVGAGYEECRRLARRVGYRECVIYRKKQAEFVSF